MPIKAEVEDVHFGVACEIKTLDGGFRSETLNFVVPPMIGDSIIPEKFPREVIVTGRQFYSAEDKERGEYRMQMVLFCEEKPHKAKD